MCRFEKMLNEFVLVHCTCVAQSMCMYICSMRDDTAQDWATHVMIFVDLFINGKRILYCFLLFEYQWNKTIIQIHFILAKPLTFLQIKGTLSKLN